ncbi:MAG: hypothetical protein AB8I08_24080 [Sandaracinaceae bacterium]
MQGIERRWGTTVLSGFAPSGAQMAPMPGEIDWARGLDDFLDRASFEGRWAVRLGLLMAMTAPVWLWGRLRSAARLSEAERARLLDALLAHRFYAVRELALLLKLVACMTLFRSARLRGLSGYDPAPSAKRALAVLPRQVA